LISSVSYKTTGIVNGIDTDTYNPENDKNISVNYNKENLEGKAKNKLLLQKDLGLTQDKNTPMIAMVTRLVDQKGVELLGPIMSELLYNDVQLVILGNGDPHYENMLRYYAEYYWNKLKVNIFYDNNLAMRMYAASDIYLMPSKFEPCGISQMIAQRYGSLPVVRETGGLKDTVIPYNKYSNAGDGFTFANYTSEDFLSAIKRALNLYNDKEKWSIIIRNAMKKDNSWENSAKEYLNLYLSISK
ncbi:MAG: glycosyltransferase, partial [Clostridiaceae bacterium]